MSLPLPPKMVSAVPFRSRRKSSPSPPNRRSLPSDPSIKSFPPAPSSVTLNPKAPLPVRWSSTIEPRNDSVSENLIAGGDAARAREAIQADGDTESALVVVHQIEAGATKHGVSANPA